MVLLAGREAELGQDARHVRFNGALGEEQPPRDTPVGTALGHERQHLALPGGEPGQRISPPLVPDELRDDLGVERRATPRDPAQRIEELVDVEDPVLEQVAEPARGDQVERRPGLDVLGQQHDPEIRVVGAQVAGGPRAVGSRVWRHVDVDDGQVGTGLVHGGGERVGVPDGGDDLVACVGEEPGEALAEQDGIFGDHRAHGSTASIRVPRPAVASTVPTDSRPPAAATRSTSPASPEPGRACAPPRPSSLIRTWTWPS